MLDRGQGSVHRADYWQEPCATERRKYRSRGGEKPRDVREIIRGRCGLLSPRERALT
jgi:hypothetical protein